MKKDKTVKKVYYKDENDDFAGTDIKAKPIDGGFKYIHRSFLWKIAEFVVYHVIAVPLVWTASKLYMGLRYENRKAAKKIKGAFFLYGNHTHAFDAFTVNLVANPRRMYTITSPDAVSVPGIGGLVQMLGAIPVPGNLKATRNFEEAIKERYSEGGCIGIFPEAHIWPYCGFIRNFPSTSFIYPVKLGAPVLAMTTTYRKRRLPFIKRPKMTVTLSEPIYPDMSLPAREAAKKLRDEVYSFMESTMREKGSYKYIDYIRDEETAE